MADEKRKAVVSNSSRKTSASFVSDANGNGPASAMPVIENGHNNERTLGGENLQSQPAKTRMISERKLQANRANAKKSTGPRTPQGKDWARRNAVKHGLLSTALLLRSDHTPVEPELQAVREALQQRFGQGDVRTEPLVEAVIIELSHQRSVTALEDSCFPDNFDDSRGPLSLRTLLRYRTSSHRKLLKHFAQLSALPRQKP